MTVRGWMDGWMDEGGGGGGLVVCWELVCKLALTVAFMTSVGMTAGVSPASHGVVWP